MGLIHQQPGVNVNTGENASAQAIINTTAYTHTATTITAIIPYVPGFKFFWFQYVQNGDFETGDVHDSVAYDYPNDAELGDTYQITVTGLQPTTGYLCRGAAGQDGDPNPNDP